MFYVYEIRKCEGLYVGCTNSIKRRKDQHNENARLSKSRLGVFLKENNIILNTNDLNVVATFKDRHSALMHERYLTKKYDKLGYYLLNDNYTKACTRKGNRNVYIEYYILDLEKHTATYTKDLHIYCKEKGLSYKAVCDTLRKTILHKNRYKVFYKDEWLDMEDKEKYLSLEYYEKNKNKKFCKRVEEQKREYLIKTPTGEIVKVHGLKDFSKEHNLTAGTLSNTFIKGTHKGYKVIKRM